MIIELIVTFVLFLLAYWAIHRLGSAFHAPDPVMAIADVGLVVVFVLWLLKVIPPLIRAWG